MINLKPASFRKRTVIREALLNLRARPALSAAVFIVSATAAFLLTLGTTLDVSTIASQYAAQVSSGVNVASVTSIDSSPLDAGRCAQLEGVPGVLDAGGLAGYRAINIGGTGSHATVAEVTSGYAAIIWPQLRQTSENLSVVAGRALAADQGLRPGSLVTIQEATSSAPSKLKISAVAPASQRNPRFDNYIAVIVPPTGSVSSCIFESRPGSQAGLGGLIAGWFPNTPTNLAPLTETGTVGTTPAQLFAARISQAFPALAFAAIALAALGFWTMRRSEYALYRLLGMPAAKLLLALVVEGTFLIALPECMGVLAGDFLIARNSEQAVVLDSLGLAVGQLAVLSAILPVGGMCILIAKRPISILRSAG